jgi:hypothetical protein
MQLSKEWRDHEDAHNLIKWLQTESTEISQTWVNGGFENRDHELVNRGVAQAYRFLAEVIKAGGIEV